jgi:polyhydroxyalkanoate synthase subunit PhaC
MKGNDMSLKAKRPPYSAAGETEQVENEGFRAMDRMREALSAQLSGGISPNSLALAYFDWWLHLASAPGKRMEIAGKAVRKAERMIAYLTAVAANPDAPDCIEPLEDDHRFRHPGWQQQPYATWVQAFLLSQQWWHNVTKGVPGVMPHHEEVVSFVARQLLDMASPSNFPFANPEVIQKAIETSGGNFVQGFRNWLEDASRQATGQLPAGADAFIVGRDLAVTPGKVVYSNHLIELIQYAPTTESVHSEPVLIVPAWIMKYYILDLSPEDSLIRHLVGQGHTVFCISWRNPDAGDRDLAFDDYRRMGVMAALDAIGAIVPGRKIHAAGYCLGGTLLAIVAAAMGDRADDRLASVTLLAAQTDFTEPGELALFIDHSQMHLLESMMWNRGYLSADQMAGAFQLLRSNDLIWSRLVHDYMMGERAPMSDIMAWNADATRMPYRMHADYLRHLYVDNELASGRFMVDGRPAALQNIRVPLFVVATERDHVAPWRSVYKLHQLVDTEMTFVLASGGHNTGIVSAPGHPGRSFRVGLQKTDDIHVGPDEWLPRAAEKEGSWWPEWEGWLAGHSAPDRVDPPETGAAGKGYPVLGDAPGTFVFQR